MHAGDADERLDDIRCWMLEGRRVMTESWRSQLWWGGLCSVALVATWWAVYQESWSVLPLVWPVTLAIGWVGSVVIARVTPSRARNQATRSVEGIWIGAGATLTLVGLLGPALGAIDPAGLPCIVAAVLGGAYWATDRATDIGWLRWVAVVWWVGAVLLLVVPSNHALLVLAAMALLFEAGPALILGHDGRATP